MKILKSFQKWHLFWVWGRERERRAIVQKKRDSVVSSIYSRLNTHGPKMQFALLFNAIKCSQWTAAKRRALLALCCITCVVETFRTHDWKLMHGLSSQLGKLHCIDFVSVTLLWKGCRVLTLAVAQANHRHQSTQIFYQPFWELRDDVDELQKTESNYNKKIGIGGEEKSRCILRRLVVV